MAAKAVCALFVLGPATMTPAPHLTHCLHRRQVFHFLFQLCTSQRKAPPPSTVDTATEKPVITVGDVELRFGNEERTNN